MIIFGRSLLSVCFILASEIPLRMRFIYYLFLWYCGDFWPFLSKELKLMW